MVKGIHLYEAKVSAKNNFKLYYGTCEGGFKSHFYSHTKTFPDRGSTMELSKQIWQLKEESKKYKIR